MKSCVIDIGSNTIRAVCYDGNCEIFNMSVRSMLFDYTYNSTLSDDGMAALAAAVGRLCDEADCKYNCHAFATSAFRDLINRQTVVDYVRDSTGVEIRILSGEEEAECDYLGIRGLIGNTAGVGMDLGGGSCQLISFSEDGPELARSFDIGTARLRNRFVENGLPTQEEYGRIYEYVSKMLDVLQCKGNKLIALGGSARAVMKIKNTLLGTSQKDEITADQLDALIAFAKNQEAEMLFKQLVQNRYDTAAVGMIIMKAVCAQIGADSIQVLKCGVRDGFVQKYVM